MRSALVSGFSGPGPMVSNEAEGTFVEDGNDQVEERSTAERELMQRRGIIPEVLEDHLYAFWRQGWSGLWGCCCYIHS